VGQLLFQRACRVTVGNANGTTAYQTTFSPGSMIPGLRVRFEFTRTLRPEPSTAKIEIFNMAQQNRAQLKTRNVPVLLEAGYTNTIAAVFSGQARTIDHKRKGTDWITTITVGDGEVPFRFVRLSKGYGAGTGTLQVVKDLAGALGPLTPGSLQNLAAALTDQFANGHAVHGPAALELSKILHGRGLEWSIQHGQVQILPVGQPSQQTAVLLSPSTGLIDSPEYGTASPVLAGANPPHTLTFRALIQPTLQVGGLASLQSRVAKGLFRIAEIKANGDTQGGDGTWVMACESNPTS
jgi:hypothetical protein